MYGDIRIESIIQFTFALPVKFLEDHLTDTGDTVTMEDHEYFG